MITKVYFTFGNWVKFPHHNTYMVVEAESFDAAIAAFRKKYPDVYENTLNCSDYYREETWKERIEPQYYKGIPPAEILRTETVENIYRMQVLLENAIGLAADGMSKNNGTKQWLLEELGTTGDELQKFGIRLDF